MNKKKKIISKTEDNEGQVIENNIKINIDLNDLKTKPEKKKKRVYKKKPINPDDLKGGANSQSSSLAPRPFGSTKMPSPDTNNNPNNNTNMLIATALTNALGNRPVFNNTPLQPPTLPQQQFYLPAPPTSQPQTQQQQDQSFISRANSTWAQPNMPSMSGFSGFTSLSSTPINSPLFRNVTAQQTYQPELKRYEELLRKVSSLTSAETEEFANLESRITREQRKQIEDKIKLTTSPAKMTLTGASGRRLSFFGGIPE